MSRRHFLTGLGLSAGAGVIAGSGGLAAMQTAGVTPGAVPAAVPFRGAHQAGITTVQQENLHIVAVDVISKDKNDLKNMLSQWTTMAERMTQGLPAADEDSASEYAVPKDSGEAQDLGAQNLTITIGYGPSLFDDRFGLRDRKPGQLDPLPIFPGDQLRMELCDGDIVIQACADDPQVAVHAVRNMVRAGSGTVEVRWSQLGYGRASSTSQEQATFARYRHSGAPLGLEDDPAKEFDTVPFDLVLGTESAIPTDSHVFLSHPDNNGGQRMLRRAYNFIEGSDNFGHLSAGLFFIAFVGEPEKSFIPVQMKLSRNDRMNEYVRYESKAIFACPASLPADGSLDWGSQLFGN